MNFLIPYFFFPFLATLLIIFLVNIYYAIIILSFSILGCMKVVGQNIECMWMLKIEYVLPKSEKSEKIGKFDASDLTVGSFSGWRNNGRY